MDDLTTMEQTDPPSPRSASPLQASPHFRKILESTEEIINSQAVRIFELSQENHRFKKEREHLLSKICLLESLGLGTPSLGEEEADASKKMGSLLADRVVELERELAATKTSLALAKQQLLEERLKAKQSNRDGQGNADILSSGQFTERPPLRKEMSSRIRILEKFVRASEEGAPGEADSQYQKWNALWSEPIRLHIVSQKLINAKGFRAKTWELVKEGGIPASLRNCLWVVLFENKLGIGDSLYSEFARRRELYGVGCDKVSLQIDKDMKRSFSGKTQFEQKLGLKGEVQELLEVFHMFRPDISYVQGMTYPAIVLQLVVGKYKAFTIFCSLIIGNEFFRRLFMFDQEYLSLYCRAFEALLKDKLPRVHAALQEKDIHAEVYLVEWFFTFFSRGLSYEATLQIWDRLAYESELLFYKLGLTIFECLEPALSHSSYEETIGMIREFSAYFSESQFFQTLNAQKLTHEKLQKFFEKAMVDIVV